MAIYFKEYVKPYGNIFSQMVWSKREMNIFNEEIDYSTSFSTKFEKNIFTMEIPGIPKENVKVYFKDSLLTIKIKDDEEIVKKYNITKGFVIKSATCDHGLLTIYFEKEKEELEDFEIKLN